MNQDLSKAQGLINASLLQYTVQYIPLLELELF